MNLCNWAYAVTAAVILAAASACVTTPAKSPQQAERDRETAADVQRALAADKSIYTEHVNVRADNGVVHLSGYYGVTLTATMSSRPSNRCPASTRSSTRWISSARVSTIRP